MFAENVILYSYQASSNMEHDQTVHMASFPTDQVRIFA